MKKDNILIIGYFGKRSKILEGQSVKTRNISHLLKEMGNHVSEFDTESFRYDTFAVINLLNLLLRAKRVCILPAFNNLKWIFPFIYILSFVFRYKLYVFTIGGRLHIYLKTLPLHRYMLKHIERIFNETQLLEKELRELYGFKNLTYCPNFKFAIYNPTIHHTPEKLNLVFFARIIAEKGLDVIFNYCKYLKGQNRTDVHIDFYGMIDPKDKEYFEREIKLYPFVMYGGVIQQDVIPKKLEKYDAMLFPTHYPTEGIPGSILDAYIAGIPVIASNWVYATELIDNRKTGIIIPFENNEQFFIEACESLADEDFLNTLKKNAYKKGLEYRADNVKKILKEFF